MYRHHGSHGLAALALFGVCAAAHAQLALNTGQPLAADPAADYAASTVRPGALADTALTAPTFEQKGDAHFVRKEYLAALREYAKIKEPSTEAWDKMGIAHQLMFDLKDAERCYRESLKLDPDNSHTLNNFAALEDSLRNYPAAERFYKKALRSDPRSALILKNLGTNLLNQHQLARGADAYAQALAIDPHILDRHYGPTVNTRVPVGELGASSYLKARSCARAGLAGCAIANLRQAFNQGSATLKKVANENDFESLRQEPEFQSLLAEQK